MSFFKGWFGEKKAAFALWASLDSETYTRFHNIIIPSSNGTAQIDHLVISTCGIFIVETKNKSGWIFGSEDRAEWTQTMFGKKYSFQNPLRQLYRQKKILAQFLDIDENIIQTICYFVGDAKFKTELPKNVINYGIGNYIRNFSEHLLAKNDLEAIISEIERHSRESTLTNADHIDSLRARHSSTDTCPNCGAPLRVKEARKGARQGMKFLGCVTYPKCRFTKSA